MLGSYCYVHSHYTKMIWACSRCGNTKGCFCKAHGEWMCRSTLYKVKKAAGTWGNTTKGAQMP